MTITTAPEITIASMPVLTANWPVTVILDRCTATVTVSPGAQSTDTALGADTWGWALPPGTTHEDIRAIVDEAQTELLVSCREDSIETAPTATWAIHRAALRRGLGWDRGSSRSARRAALTADKVPAR